MSRRPVVLLPPDVEIRDTRRGPVPQLVAQRAYTDAILGAGGLPWVMPPLQDEAGLRQLVETADALVVAGGAHDVDPALYGEAPLPSCGELKPERTHLEHTLLLLALERGLPILGICGGMQLLNVARGGTLWQDLPSQQPSEIVHLQPPSLTKDKPIHEVRVERGTRLFGLCQTERLPVNSTHHQAVRSVGRGLIVTARADDNVVEGIEDPELPFCVGVQWHPESMREPAHQSIYRGLIDAARSRLHTPARDRRTEGT